MYPSNMIEDTLIIIKPDAVKRGIVGEIISRFEKAGLKIVGMKMVWIQDEHAEEHYKEHVGKSFFESLKEYITSGPVIAMVLEGVNAVEVVRKMVGSTEPGKALPGTIRGDYCHLSIEWADKRGKPCFNIIHASSDEESAKREIELWFKPEEIHDYKRSDEDFLM